MSFPVTYDDNSTEYVGKEIGHGAQGSIYACLDGEHAVKLYEPDSPVSPQTRVQILQRLSKEFNPAKDDPYWENNFAWPDKVVLKPRVGYRMRLARDMRTMIHYIVPSAFNALPPTEQGWFLGRVAAAIQIAAAAARMSGAGISYPDASYNNIMVNSFTGRGMFIDNDSVTIPNTVPPEILGTKYFLAPELWTQQQRTPTTTSDRYAFATIYYFYLVGYHPLQGDKVHFPNEPERDEQATYGQRALYIEDPTDRSNRKANQRIFARMLGPELEALFTQAFHRGLQNPTERPQPQQWLRALTHTFDWIVPCETSGDSCWWHSFVALPDESFICPCCRQRLREARTLPFVYLLPHKHSHDPESYDETIGPDKHHVVAWPGRILNEWHCVIGKSPWHTDPQHPVSRTPQAIFACDDSGHWSLKNTALPQMEVQTGQSTWTKLPIGRAVPLTNNLLLRFGPGPTHYRAKVELHTLV